MRAARQRSVFGPLLGLLIASAWVTLWLWAASPYGRYLDHGSWLQAGLGASLCRALPAGEVLLPAAIYVGGWLLMTAAMMLPTTLPLLEIVERITAARPDRSMLLGAGDRRLPRGLGRLRAAGAWRRQRPARARGDEPVADASMAG